MLLNSSTVLFRVLTLEDRIVTSAIEFIAFVIIKILSNRCNIDCFIWVMVGKSLYGLFDSPVGFNIFIPCGFLIFF